MPSRGPGSSRSRTGQATRGVLSGGAPQAGRGRCRHRPARTPDGRPWAIRRARHQPTVGAPAHGTEADPLLLQADRWSEPVLDQVPVEIRLLSELRCSERDRRRSVLADHPVEVRAGASARPSAATARREPSFGAGRGCGTRGCRCRPSRRARAISEPRHRVQRRRLEPLAEDDDGVGHVRERQIGDLVLDHEHRAHRSASGELVDPHRELKPAGSSSTGDGIRNRT